MGMADRNYPPERRRGPGFLANVTPVVRWLLIANVGIYLVDTLFLKHALRYAGSFTIPSAIFGFQVWEFLSFQFIHGHLGHLMLNTIGLYFLGPFMERWWGAGRFLIFYLLTGAAGAGLYTLLAFLGVVDSGYLMGASAGIYGIFIGVAVVAPQLRVRLLIPPVELSMRQLAIALMVISLVLLTSGILGNEGGEAGHLGGAIAGFLLVKFPGLIPWKRRQDDVEIIRPRAFSRTSEAKLRPRSRVDFSQDSEVDRILDKISRDGFQSLTAEERETLQRAAKDNQS